MKRLKDFITEAVRYGENRCTAVTCNALAAHHNIPEAKLGPDHNVFSGVGVIQHLTKHGLKVKGGGWEHQGKTVSRFIKEHPTGSHYISTRGHAMALINGKLHDSSNRGADDRKIELSFEITK